MCIPCGMRPARKRSWKAAAGPSAQAVSLGDAGFAYAQSVVFRKGHSLVRIVAYQSTPETQPALLALARGVETRL